MKFQNFTLSSFQIETANILIYSLKKYSRNTNFHFFIDCALAPNAFWFSKGYIMAKLLISTAFWGVAYIRG